MSETETETEQEQEQEQETKQKQQDEKRIEENLSMRSPVIYEVIRQEGEVELGRPVKSLWWSGLAAGIALSTSVYCEAYLHMHLPDSEWRPLVENFGYSVGFIIVILGRFQLFTENTITVILPVLQERSRRCVGLMLRLWAVVLTANLLGSFASALLTVYAGLATGPQLQAMLEVSAHAMIRPPLELLTMGVPAGFFIAALVWCLPSAKGAEFWVILLLTYIIALGEFTHVIAGSTETFLLLLNGQLDASSAFLGLGAALVGNVLGGTFLFALLAYTQVKDELIDE